jgi:hypothetical protein
LTRPGPHDSSVDEKKKIGLYVMKRERRKKKAGVVEVIIIRAVV